MAKQVTEYQRTVRGNENTGGAGGNNNNVYQKDFEKTVSNDNYSDGMGIARPSALMSMENIPGLEQSDQYMLKMREVERFNSLKPAMGNPAITNKGIVLDSFGGMFGQGGSKPDIQGGANK